MFTGFDNRTFEFYMAIRHNNNRAFFEENRAWYDESVKRPMLELIEALAPTALAIDDALDARPIRCLARVHRDMRHAHGNPPYRDYSFMKFRQLGDARYTMLGLFFDLSDEGASYGMGIYDKNVPLMNALRREINTHAEHVESLVLQAQQSFEFFPNTIKRMPIPDSVPPSLARWYPLRAFSMQKPLRENRLTR